jgi:hypothetical protein
MMIPPVGATETVIHASWSRLKVVLIACELRLAAEPAARLVETFSAVLTPDCPFHVADHVAPLDEVASGFSSARVKLSIWAVNGKAAGTNLIGERIPSCIRKTRDR